MMDSVPISKSIQYWITVVVIASLMTCLCLSKLPWTITDSFSTIELLPASQLPSKYHRLESECFVTKDQELIQLEVFYRRMLNMDPSKTISIEEMAAAFLNTNLINGATY